MAEAKLVSNINSSLLLLLLVLPIAQLATGASMEYAVMSAAFNLLVALAVRLNGGLFSVGGAIIAIIALKSPLLGHVVKIFVASPPEDGLILPLQTMGVLATGMAMAALGAFFARLLVPPLQILRPQLSPRMLDHLWLLACFLSCIKVFGPPLGLPVVFLKAMTYFSFSDTLAIAAITARCMLVSGRRRAFDRRTLLTVGIFFAMGFGGGSKQAMLEAIGAWFVTIVAFGYPMTWRAMMPMTVFALLFQFVFFPIAQSRSLFRDASAFDRLQKLATTGALDDKSAADLNMSSFDFGNLMAFRTERDISMGYLGFEPMFLQRIVLTPIGDRLVGAVERGGPIGWERAATTFTVIPREISGEGADGQLSNLLGRVSGILGDNDFVTGVSFGPFIENYAIQPGPEFLVLTAVGFFVMTALTLLLGSRFHQNIWAVLLLFMLQHNLSETSSVVLTVIVTRAIPTVLVIYVLFSGRSLAAKNAGWDQPVPPQDPGRAIRSVE